MPNADVAGVSCALSAFARLVATLFAARSSAMSAGLADRSRRRRRHRRRRQRHARRAATELKQFRWVAGKPMLLHSVQAFMRAPDVALVVCVLPQRYAGDPPPWLFQCDVDRLLVSIGGRDAQRVGVRTASRTCLTRRRSSLVHDAARPLVERRDDRSRHRRGARGHAARSRRCPSSTRSRKSTPTGRIVRTVDRERALARADAAGLPARRHRARARRGARRARDRDRRRRAVRAARHSGRRRARQRARDEGHRRRRLRARRSALRGATE